jgi:predicted restriction endonuclease
LSAETIKWSENQYLLMDLAIHYISILRKLVQGDSISRERELQNYAKKKYGLKLRKDQLRGLFHYHPTGGRFVDVGLEANTGHWLSMERDEALKELDMIEISLIKRLDNIHPSSMSIRKLKSTPRRTRRSRTKPKDIVFDLLANDLRPPERAEVMITRVIRNTKMSNELKELYQWKCQICGFSIEIPGKGRYCEVHHLMPLAKEHAGPDIRDNMICLCPNHHTQMDYGILYIDSSTLTVFHSDENDPWNGVKIQLVGDHRPADRYLDYHRDEFCSSWLV